MRDILCMYYSRTGATRQAMTEIAQALDAELVELTDGVDRSGARAISAPEWTPCAGHAAAGPL